MSLFNNNAELLKVILDKHREERENLMKDIMVLSQENDSLKMKFQDISKLRLELELLKKELLSERKTS